MTDLTTVPSGQSIPQGQKDVLERAHQANLVRTTSGKPQTIKQTLLHRLNYFNPGKLVRRRARKRIEAEVEDKTIITTAQCDGELGKHFSTGQKWFYLCVVFGVQVSMNFNASLYSNGIRGIAKEFNVTETAARAGAAVFLVAYAFGCELWAPWSEEIGRWPILQASLFLVNVFQLPVALATNFKSIIVARTLGGLSTAGGSITLGMVADMWDKDDHQIPVAFVVFSSVGGSVLGPIVGGFLEEDASWRWCMWVQLAFGVLVQLLHFFLVPETRSTILMDQIAKRRRRKAIEENPDEPLNLYGPNEVTPYRERLTITELLLTWGRPFRMLVTEWIVLWLSLLSGFGDALIFMFLQSFGLVYGQWNFSPSKIGIAFSVSFLVAYALSWASFIPAIRRNKVIREKHPTSEHAQFESRLWWLLWTAPFLSVGLLGFALSSTGPPLHWIVSLVFAGFCGIANYAIYMATIDYMVTAYGPFAASATGGNGWARDLLAGILTVPSIPFYQNLGYRTAGLILFGFSVPLVASVFVIYRNGPKLRARSPFAQQLKESYDLGHDPNDGLIPGHGAYGSSPGSRMISPRRSLDGDRSPPRFRRSRPNSGPTSRSNSVHPAHRSETGKNFANGYPLESLTGMLTPRNNSTSGPLNGGLTSRNDSVNPIPAHSNVNITSSASAANNDGDDAITSSAAPGYGSTNLEDGQDKDKIFGEVRYDSIPQSSHRGHQESPPLSPRDSPIEEIGQAL